MEAVKDNSFDKYRNSVLKTCEKHADRDMIRCLMANGRVQKIKYARLGHLIDCFAKVKEEYGLKDGDRVLLLTHMTADAYLSFAVLSANHLTVVMADPGIPTYELLYQAEITEISAIFADKRLAPRFDSIKDVPVFSTFSLKSDMELLRNAEVSRKSYDTTPDSIAIVFSSGTTSRMKPIEISHSSVLLSADLIASVIKLRKRHPEMMSFNVFPVNHISGLSSTLVALLYSHTVATLETVSSDALAAGIRMFEPISFSMVPRVLSMYIRKLEEGLRARGKYDTYLKLKQISRDAREKHGNRRVSRVLMAPYRNAVFGRNIENIYSGGAPCPPELTRDMLDLGINFIVNYSSTECGVPISQSDSSINDCLDSVGRVNANPEISIRINGQDADGIGEIYVNTPLIMKGYYNDPEKTAGSFDGEWFKTGDNGYIDDKGYLHIAGRSKDSVLLASGKKVSPDDLETMLEKALGPDIQFAVTGVPSEESGYDTIHVFVADISEEDKRAEVAEKIRRWQRDEARLYPIEGIHFIDALPKTSIGKVKRAELRKMANEDASDQTEGRAEATERKSSTNASDPAGDEIFARVNQIVMQKAEIREPLTGIENLSSDLGLDSLTMMEICNEIENEFGIFIGTYLIVLPNTREIADYIKDPIFKSASEMRRQARMQMEFDAFEFPRPRTAAHRAAFEFYRRWFRKNIDFEIRGLENIRKGESYIFCPNHQTHADGIWMWDALGEKMPPLDNIGCMAKAEHLDTAKTRFMLTMLGGIPVDREGNTMDSFKRSIEFIREGNSFLVHPEGTRTRNGKLGAFKSGAALMARESDVSIVPVAIDGGLDVWSYDMKAPVMRDADTKQKKHVRITFCKPVAADAGDPDEITARVRKAVEDNL